MNNNMGFHCVVERTEYNQDTTISVAARKCMREALDILPSSIKELLDVEILTEPMYGKPWVRVSWKPINISVHDYEYANTFLYATSQNMGYDGADKAYKEFIASTQTRQGGDWFYTCVSSAIKYSLIAHWYMRFRNGDNDPIIAHLAQVMSYLEKTLTVQLLDWRRAVLQQVKNMSKEVPLLDLSTIAERHFNQTGEPTMCHQCKPEQARDKEVGVNRIAVFIQTEHGLNIDASKATLSDVSALSQEITEAENRLKTLPAGIRAVRQAKKDLEDFKSAAYELLDFEESNSTSTSDAEYYAALRAAMKGSDSSLTFTVDASPAKGKKPSPKKK